MDHGQNTEDFWQMTATQSDLNLTGEGLTGVTDTELHALEPHSCFCTGLSEIDDDAAASPAVFIE